MDLCYERKWRSEGTFTDGRVAPCTSVPKIGRRVADAGCCGVKIASGCVANGCLPI